MLVGTAIEGRISIDVSAVVGFSRVLFDDTVSLRGGA